MELQMHLASFHELKTKVATASVNGMSGHERYIEFRGLKEQAEFSRERQQAELKQAKEEAQARRTVAAKTAAENAEAAKAALPKSPW
jgi:hypothetical protein